MYIGYCRVHIAIDDFLALCIFFPPIPFILQYSFFNLQFIVYCSRSFVIVKQKKSIVLRHEARGWLFLTANEREFT